jgi:multidrug efflux pump subunit AcrA (membrane-fusion protein)
MVPEAAMVYDRNGTYLWRMLDEDHAEKVPVKIGLRSSGEVEIVTGLSPGDAVVSAGTHKVMAGKRILTVESAGTAHAAEEPTSTPDSVPAPVKGKES